MWSRAERGLKINWPPCTWSQGKKSETFSWLEMLNTSKKKKEKKKQSDRSNLVNQNPLGLLEKDHLDETKMSRRQGGKQKPGFCYRENGFRDC